MQRGRACLYPGYAAGEIQLPVDGPALGFLLPLGDLDGELRLQSALTQLFRALRR